jgi:HSP20 family molecular chaperone IbpA
VQVHGADIQDGILAIQLKFIIPEDQRPRKINIGSEDKPNATHTNSP